MTTGFLQSTTAAIVEKFGWSNLRNVTIVFPSNRAGLVTKDALKKLQKTYKQTIFMPQVTTLSSLFDSWSPLYAEDELSSIFRLYKIYKEISHEAISPDLFYGWGRQLIADFDNVDKSIHADEVASFFQNSIEAKELEEVILSPEVAERLKHLFRPIEKEFSDHSVQQKYALIWQNLLVIYQRFTHEMRAHHKGTEGMRMRAVLEDWSTLAERYTHRQFVFVGFNYLMPVEKEFMERLHEQGQATFFWDYVPDFTTNTRAYSFIAQHIASGFINSAPSASWGDARAINIISSTTANAQAQYVTDWLRKHYTQHGQNTAIIICDENMLEPVIYALPSIHLPGQDLPEPINITKGFPLSSTQIYADVIAYLSDKSNDKLPHESYVSVLERLLSAVLTPAENAARAKNKIDDTEVDQDEKDNYSCSWEWLLIEESLYQTRLAIQQFCRLLQDPLLAEDISKLSLLRSLLRRYLEGITLPFHGEPITDIQLMGVLETRMLDFDNLLLLNVEEGVVPRRQADISFIPYYLRKSYHMQTHDEQASVYAYNFFRLLNRAKHVTILYSDADTAMGRKSMSRFLMQILVSKEFSVSKYTLTESNQLRMESFSQAEGNGLSLIATLQRDNEGHLCRQNNRRFSLSPSAINTYIECPRRFYFQYLLHVREQEVESAIFAPNTLGSFVHHAMEYIYREHDTNLDHALVAAYESMNAEYARIHEYDSHHYRLEAHRMENVVIQNFARNILARDTMDSPQGLTIERLEEAMYFDVSLPYGLGVLQVGGSIDRLDKLGKKLRVIDYKTGSYDEKKMSANSEELFTDSAGRYVLQTLIYSETIAANYPSNEPIEPNLFFTQKDLTLLDTTIKLDKKAVTDYRQVRDTFIPSLTEKIYEIMTTTSFPQQTKEDKCSSFCPFLTICGRDAKTY